MLWPNADELEEECQKRSANVEPVTPPSGRHLLMNQLKVKICCNSKLCDNESRDLMPWNVPGISPCISRISYWYTVTYNLLNVCVLSGPVGSCVLCLAKEAKWTSTAAWVWMELWSFGILRYLYFTLFVWFYWPSLSVTLWAQCKQCLLLSVWGKWYHFSFLCSIKTPHYVWGHRRWSDPLSSLSSDW